MYPSGRPASPSSARVLSFPTAIFNGDLSQLSALTAVTADYPLRGRMRIADVPFGTARVTELGKSSVVSHGHIQRRPEPALGPHRGHCRLPVAGPDAYRGCTLRDGPRHRARQEFCRFPRPYSTAT